MGLIGWFNWLRTPLPSASMDGEDLLWPGSGDLWPENPLPYRPRLQVVEDIDGPELIIAEQYGLKCPGGEVHWGSWQGIVFDQPIDRLKMVATLQQTALDMGFSADQIDDFLAYYGWVTRNQVATVVYEDTGAYSLTDPAALGTPDSREPADGHRIEAREDDSPEVDPTREVCPGSVGGDA